MNLNELLPAGAIDALATQLGIPPEQAERGAQALLPSILGGMGDRAGGPRADNATALQAQFDQLGGGELADNVLGSGPTDVARGNQLLGGIFGSKDVSREVANTASQSGGLDPALLKRMLPILTMLVAGYMTRRSGGQPGGLGSILSSVLGGLTGGGGNPGGTGPGKIGVGLGDILGSILGARR